MCNLFYLTSITLFYFHWHSIRKNSILLTKEEFFFINWQISINTIECSLLLLLNNRISCFLKILHCIAFTFFLFTSFSLKAFLFFFLCEFFFKWIIMILSKYALWNQWTTSVKIEEVNLAFLSDKNTFSNNRIKHLTNRIS